MLINIVPAPNGAARLAGAPLYESYAMMVLANGHGLATGVHLCDRFVGVSLYSDLSVLAECDADRLGAAQGAHRTRRARLSGAVSVTLVCGCPLTVAAGPSSDRHARSRLCLLPAIIKIIGYGPVCFAQLPSRPTP